MSTGNPYLVTGAAGFVGSHLVQALLADGNHVVGLDNLDPYYDPAQKEANLRELRAVEEFEFVRGDVRDSDVVEALLNRHDFATVIHLAAMPGVRSSITDPISYFEVNLIGTVTLLHACVSRAATGGFPHFVLASTSSVYGATDRIPFQEDDACDQPIAPYAASKRSAELASYVFHHVHGMAVTILRLFTVYGPRVRPDLMAYKVPLSISTGTPLSVYNGGNMYRDWTYVGDAVNGIAAAAKRPAGFQIANIGSGTTILLKDFIRLIEAQMGQRAILTEVPAPHVDMERTHADIRRASDLFDYSPRTTIDEGVEKLLEWFHLRAEPTSRSH